MTPPVTITCIRCGYDLATLADSGPCPECAYPVAESRVLTIGPAERRYLWRVVLGAVTLLPGHGLVLLTFVVSDCQRLFGWPSSSPVYTWITFAGFAVWGLGWLLLSARPPDRVRHERNVVRVCVRWLAVLHLFLVAVVLGAFVAFLSDSWPPLPPGYVALLAMITFPVWIGNSVASLVLLAEVARVALRQSRLAVWARRVGVVGGLVTLAGFLLGGFGLTIASVATMVVLIAFIRRCRVVLRNGTATAYPPLSPSAAVPQIG